LESPVPDEQFADPNYNPPITVPLLLITVSFWPSFCLILAPGSGFLSVELEVAILT